MKVVRVSLNKIFILAITISGVTRKSLKSRGKSTQTFIMIDWFLTVVRDNYANFNGRARRSEFWYFFLCHIIIAIVLATLMVLIGTIGMVLYTVYALALFIPGLAVAVRRLHDVGKSGWWYFICLVPIIGSIWFIVLLATDGDVGPNEYGEDPKRPYNEFDQIGTKEDTF